MSKPKRRSAKRSTLKDVAELAEVNVNTCSAVLNPRSTKVPVKPKTRRKVEQAARKLNYRRNAAASHLAGSASKTLGILTDRIDNYFFAPILGAFEAEAVARGYQCFIGCTHYEGSRKLEYLKRFTEYGVDGIVLTTIWHDQEVAEAMRSMLQDTTPMAFIDYPWEDFAAPVIGADHFQGGKLLAKHLIEEGHRAFTFLLTEEQRHHGSVSDRIRGVRTVIEQSPYPDIPLEIISTPVYEPRVLAETVIKRLASDRPPSAVIVSNDHVAYSLLLGLQQANCHVPDDIAVTGFDDTNRLTLRALGLPDTISFLGAVGLTTVRQPLGDIGRMAAQLLVDLIESGRPMTRELHALEVKLVKGESSRLPTRCSKSQPQLI